MRYVGSLAEVETSVGIEEILWTELFVEGDNLTTNHFRQSSEVSDYQWFTQLTYFCCHHAKAFAYGRHYHDICTAYNREELLLFDSMEESSIVSTAVFVHHTLDFEVSVSRDDIGEEVEIRMILFDEGESSDQIIKSLGSATMAVVEE